MTYFKNTTNDDLGQIISAYQLGGLTRRSFLNKAMSLGLTAGMAGAVATAWSSQVLANSTKTTAKPTVEFDYIVVGTGSAGSAVVHQLAHTGANILVLEAGRKDDLAELQDSRLWAASLGTDAVKFYPTTAQTNTDGRVHMWPAGNALGGTSSVNAMIYVRGDRANWDSWAEDGNTGWAFDDMLPHFQAFESFELGGENRGTSGPLFATQSTGDKRHPGGHSFIEACSGLGFEQTSSINSDRMTGPAWVDLNIKDGNRQSSATAFLHTVSDMPNVTIFTDAPVMNLNFKGTRCTGVTYLHNGEPHSVSVVKEVVMSAGTIDSARLLMLSGVGIAADLKALGIDPIVDLQVGNALQDHILGAGVNYEANGPLPVSHYNGAEVGMWSHSGSEVAAPDMFVNFGSNIYASPAFKLDYEHGYCFLSGLMQPESRGHIKLQSNKFSDAPTIEPNYLGEDNDWKIFRQSTELAREVGASSAFNDIRKRETLPLQNGKLTDSEWRSFLAKSVTTFFHPTGTCKMGVGEDAVVDPQLKVHGIEGLRVADASIMPNITSGNTNVPSIAIGWKCGDMIVRGT